MLVDKRFYYTTINLHTIYSPLYEREVYYMLAIWIGIGLILMGINSLRDN